MSGRQYSTSGQSSVKSFGNYRRFCVGLQWRTPSPDPCRWGVLSGLEAAADRSLDNWRSQPLALWNGRFTRSLCVRDPEACASVEVNLSGEGATYQEDQQ
jgi:hypothetical protein